MVRKGDTLIEVTLAVGIFSMIAIAVVAVMSGGTSSAQTALETTLAREEIDTQAEALRFIQSAYVADKDNKNNHYRQLWEAITKNVNTLTNVEEEDAKILQFAPDNCLALYSEASGIITQKAFVINPYKLNNFNDIDEVYVSYGSAASKFGQAQTYPHLIYGQNESNNDNNEALTDANTNTSLYRAEGIYVIAVKDNATTHITDSESSTPEKTPAFYDFYIRTCWYGTDAERPSTISTVIRLYDPTIIKTETPEEPTPEEPTPEPTPDPGN